LFSKQMAFYDRQKNICPVVLVLITVFMLFFNLG
jgi:hypothetical protein